jgi:hypothetical protein
VSRVQWLWVALCWAGIAATVLQARCAPPSEVARLRAENARLLERARSAERTAERLAAALNGLYYDRTGTLPAADGPTFADSVAGRSE